MKGCLRSSVVSYKECLPINMGPCKQRNTFEFVNNKLVHSSVTKTDLRKSY